MPAERSAPQSANVMTVDVEDYFQVSAFQDIVPRNSWDDFDSRVCQNTERLLEIFDEFGVRCKRRA